MTTQTSGARTAFVHVGPGKTGTSTLQRALSEQRDALREAGILVPGRVQMDTRRAVYDLMGRRIGGAAATDHARVRGAWPPYAAAVAASPLPTAVLSEEMLALARPRAVRRVVGDLAPRRVVVVAAVRGLEPALASYWQQMVMMGRTETLAEFLAAVRDPAAGAAGAGVGFWMRQDLLRTLDAWETAVPRSDVRLVVVPPRGAPPELLADRFAAVVGAPPGLLRSSRSRGNSSLGAAEVEAVRRLNLELGGDLTEQQRLHLMRVVGRRLGGHGRPVALPPDQLEWVRERAGRLVEELRSREYAVSGDLAELLPAPAVPPAGDGPAVRSAEVADAAVAVLGAVAREQARLLTRDRGRPGRADPGSAAPRRADLGSRARAAVFRVKTAALRRADHNRILAWAARAYLRRTSRR